MSNWTDCTKTCGTGTRSRSVVVEAKHGGQPCEGLSETCNPEPCPGKYFPIKIVFKVKFFHIKPEENQNRFDFRLNPTTISENTYLTTTGNMLNNNKMELINSTSTKTRVLQNLWKAEPDCKICNIGRDMATGGVILGNVVICGGAPFSKTCYKLGTDDCQWKWLKALSTVRSGAASIVIDDYLWVAGGDNGELPKGILKTTEKVCD